MKLALAVLACASSGALAQGTSEEHLANGATVILAPDDRVADVVVHVRVPAGNDDGDAAELVERAIDTLDAALDALGGWSNAQVARDHTDFTLEVPAEALPRALFLEMERFARVSPEEAEARREDANRDRAAIATTRSGAIARALGNEPTQAIAPVAREAIARLLRARYRPAELVVVIAGRFDRAAADAAIATYVGGLPAMGGAPRPARPPVVPAPPAASAPLRDLAAGTTIAFALPSPLTAARLDLDVAARVLASRLGTSVDAPFAITGDRAAIAAAVAALREHPVTDDELLRARAMLALEEVTALEGLAYRAQAIAAARVALGTTDYLRAWEGLLGAVTPASVQRTAARWLDPARAAIVEGR